MSTVSSAPAIGDVPDLEEIAPAYRQVLNLAERHLDGPISMRIRSWEDGEFEVRARHSSGPYPQNPDVRHKTVIRYHSEDDTVTGALLEIDTETEEQTLKHQQELTAGVEADRAGLST